MCMEAPIRNWALYTPVILQKAAVSVKHGERKIRDLGYNGEPCRGRTEMVLERKKIKGRKQYQTQKQ